MHIQEISRVEALNFYEMERGDILSLTPEEKVAFKEFAACMQYLDNKFGDLF